MMENNTENKANFNEVEILLVEDSLSDSELTLRALSRYNLANKMYTVRDGEEALEFIFCTGRYAARDITIPPKIILLDLKLPKIHGLEVLEKIKSDERTKMIPVVVVTSSQEDKDLKESYRLGVNSYIQKPIEFEAFVKALSEAGLYWLVINKSLR